MRSWLELPTWELTANRLAAYRLHGFADLVTVETLRLSTAMAVAAGGVAPGRIRADGEGAASGRARAGLVVQDPVEAVISLRWAGGSADEGLSQPDTADEVLGDFARLAAHPAVADRLLVLALSRRLQRHLAAASARSGLGLDLDAEAVRLAPPPAGSSGSGAHAVAGHPDVSAHRLARARVDGELELFVYLVDAARATAPAGSMRGAAHHDASDRAAATPHLARHLPRHLPPMPPMPVTTAGPPSAELETPRAAQPAEQVETVPAAGRPATVSPLPQSPLPPVVRSPAPSLSPPRLAPAAPAASAPSAAVGATGPTTSPVGVSAPSLSPPLATPPPPVVAPSPAPPATSTVSALDGQRHLRASQATERPRSHALLTQPLSPLDLDTSQMRTSPTIWAQLTDCVAALDQPFTRAEIIGWFRRHHPETLEVSLSAHIQSATSGPDRPTSHTSRTPLITRIDRHLYVRFDG